MSRFFIFFVSGFLATPSVLARPQYAAKQKINCSVCHVAPMGGGPRKIFGKIYGSRGLGLASTSNSELYYGDIRSQAYLSIKEPKDNRAGLALMTASAALNVPLIKKDEGYSFNTLVNFDLVNGLQDAYVYWESTTQKSIVPTHILLGKFTAPFGLLTDEHRTYSKMLVKNRLGRDFETGVNFSGDIGKLFHYDFALVNGFRAASVSTGDLTYGAIFNLRHTPPGPVSPGISLGYHKNAATNASPTYAFSLYNLVSFSNLTSLPLTLMAEGVLARNWNSQLASGTFFIPSSLSVYKTAVASSQALAIYAEADYEVTSSFILLYKYDYLSFDTRFSGDAYHRHGLGVKYWLNSNASFQVRVEKALVGRPEIKNSLVKADQDAVWMLFRVWI